MKKILSILMAFAIFLGMFSVLCGVFVSAAGETVYATVWTPTEISLTSSVTYSNPYTDATIDAVFTHESGTKISLPGFNKDKNTAWAVRFSPTKAGKWTYKITCSDKSNAGLNVSGTLIATEGSSDNALVKHGFVRVSDNCRYYTYNDGTPFFWLGDTNWQAPNYINTEKCNYPGCSCGSQFKHEVDNRVQKGFTVYQTYFDTAESDGGGQRGNLASIWITKYKKPSYTVFNNKIDSMFEYLFQSGMVVALGLGVHSNTMNNIGEEDFLRFVRYIVARYACYSIVWISGQEITNTSAAKATSGKQVMDIYMNGSALIEQLDGYKHPNGAHMYPMTSTDERAKRLDNASWHDVWILQAGHGANLAEKYFYKSYYENSSGTVKPFIEGEANYEDINCGGFTGYDASRRSAWKAMLCGCAGFTYGVTGIWANCYSNYGNTGWYGISSYSYEPWYIGLDKPGSYEVGYMKSFFEALPDWYSLVPRYSDKEYMSFYISEYKILASTDNADTFVCYFCNKGTETGTIKKLDSGKSYNAWWFNPLTGGYIPLESVSGVSEYNVPEKPDKNDWVLLLTSNDLGEVKTEEKYNDLYADNSDNTIYGDAVTPKSVSAIGGCYYEKSGLIDNTAKLFDGNTATTWSPLADRTTQTIIYDLGEIQSLTHLTVTPESGTTLPKYRIECSVDGKNWTIVANASTREMKWSEDKTYISEKLNGKYRYVKLLLLNAENESKTTEHKQTENSGTYYSHTSIAEMTVYCGEYIIAPAPEPAEVDYADAAVVGTPDSTEAEETPLIVTESATEQATAGQVTVEDMPVTDDGYSPVSEENDNTALIIVSITGGIIVGVSIGIIVYTLTDKGKKLKPLLTKILKKLQKKR